jgi:acetyl-CoA acetyltransferase
MLSWSAQIFLEQIFARWSVMTLRRKAAIVGMGELPTRRTYPGRTTTSLCTEAARIAIADAGLSKEDVDGLITRGSDVSPTDLAEYTGLHVGFCEGVTQHGSSGSHAVVAAAAAIHAGLAHTVLCVFGGTRDPAVGGFGPGVVRGMPLASKGSAFEAPFGPTPGANTGYALMKRRHIYEFGTTQEPFTKMAVHQRFNALINLNAVFQGSLSLSKTSSLHAWSMIPCTGWNVSCPPGVRLRAS